MLRARPDCAAQARVIYTTLSHLDALIAAGAPADRLRGKLNVAMLEVQDLLKGVAVMTAELQAEQDRFEDRVAGMRQSRDEMQRGWQDAEGRLAKAEAKLAKAQRHGRLSAADLGYHTHDTGE